MQVVTRIRSSLLAMALLPVLAACLGRATPPEQVKLTQAQNEVLGKFARQVGEKELNILLKDPNDTTLPGIPVGDLLYILSRVNEDKLIKLVKGITATTTLELILAIKRVGCTRYEYNYPGNGFDARLVSDINRCTWQHFHLPNIMVQLLNGADDQGLNILIDTVRHNYPELGLPPNQPLIVSCAVATCPPLHAAPYTATVSHYAYLMKLAFIVAGFDYPNLASDPTMAAPDLPGPAKLFGLMNLTNVGRDMVFLLDSFDRNACPVGPVADSNCVYVDTLNVLNTYDTNGNLWRDIQDGFQFQRLRNLLRIIDLVQDTNKMAVLLNGRRQAPSTTAQDEQQIRYYIDRLKVVLEHSAPGGVYNCPVAGYPLVWPDFPASNEEECDLQNYTKPQGPSHALPADPGDEDEWNQKLAALINRIPLANMDRMMELVYDIEDGFDLSHTTATPNFPPFPRRGIDNLLVLINNINRHAAHNVGTAVCTLTQDTGAATDTPCNTELMTAAYLINNVAPDPLNNNPAKRNKVKYLVQYMGNTQDVLRLACYTAVADQIDGVAPADVTPDKCDNRGFINLVADGSKFADDNTTTDLTAAGQKLAVLADQIQEIESMRFLLRKVDMGNMSQIVAGMQIASATNVADLVNQIEGDNCWNETNGIIGLPPVPLAGSIDPALGTGGGYTFPPTVGFTGPGSGAFAKAVIETDPLRAGYQTVKDVIIIDSGNGYTSNAFTFTSGGGAGASASFRVGNCRYNQPPSPPPYTYRGIPTASGTGATGLGKMVNVINHITGSPGTIVTLINGVTDGTKLGLLINDNTRSSNLVGVMNAVVDASRSNNASINDLISLLNNLSREDILKMVHLLENLGDAREVDAQVTVPSIDHDMVAQLMAPYNPATISTTSGIGTATLARFLALLRYDGGNGLSTEGNIFISGGGGSGAAAAFTRTTPGAISSIELASYGSGCTAAPTVTISGGGGTGATATAILDADAQQVSYVRVDNPGSGYTTTPTVTFSGGCATLPSAMPTGQVGTIDIVDPGSACTVAPTVSLSGGGGSGATAIAVIDPITQTLRAVEVTSPGSGYSAAPTVVFLGGSCGTMPTAVSQLRRGALRNRVGSITITNPGTGYTNNPTSCVAVGVNLTCQVSGAINSLANFYGGSGYTTGDVCPITGAGGSGGECTVTASGGALTGCSTITGGANYADDRIVKIGGRAEAVAIVTGAVVTAVNVTNTGCGYVGTPTVEVVGCTTAPTLSATMSAGRVTGVTVVTGGSGCPVGAKVVIGENPFVAHADGASAIVQNVTGGRLTLVSVSEPAVNAAQLIQLIDRDATGITSGTRGFSITYNGTSPNISAREAMVRLLHHGITTPAGSAKSYFSEGFGLGSVVDVASDGVADNLKSGVALAGAGIWNNSYPVNWPGVGVTYVANSILNNLSGVNSTQTLINMLNTNTTDLADTMLLLGCGDRSTYVNTAASPFTWQRLCTENGPGLW